jgi:hypothetical protein
MFLSIPGPALPCTLCLHNFIRAIAPKAGQVSAQHLSLVPQQGAEKFKMDRCAIVIVLSSPDASSEIN